MKTENMKFFAASLAALACLVAAPDRPLQAEEKSGTFRNLEIRTQRSPRSGWFITTNQAYQLKKQNKNRTRSYSFYSYGYVMAFIGTDDYDTDSKSTGCRTFQFLPFRESRVPSFREVDENTVEAMLPSGHRALFSTEKGELLSIEGYDITFKPIQHFDVMVKESGGVAITPKKGNLVLDYGWRTGGSAREQLWRTSVVLDSRGGKFTLKNSDVIIKDPKDPDEVIFKYLDNESMKGFLLKKFPTLKGY